MQIKILWIGKESRSPFGDAEQEILKRLTQWTKVEYLQVNSNKEFPSAEELMNAERKLIETKLEQLKGFSVVLLHEEGKEYTSKEFSKFVSNAYENSESLCFVIGGAFGLSRELIKDPRFKKISLSKMTYPHHVARFLLTEQIYRAFTIFTGHPYHK